MLLHEVSKPESISIFWLSFSSSLVSLSLSLPSNVNFTPSTEYKSEFVKFSVAGQRHPVRKVVDLSRLAQMLVSVHQCELVAQADFTLREIRNILGKWLNFSKKRNKEHIFKMLSALSVVLCCNIKQSMVFIYSFTLLTISCHVQEMCEASYWGSDNL